MRENPMLLHLFHGRRSPTEEMDGWGEDGPYFRIDWFHMTYFSTFQVQPEEQDQEIWGDEFMVDDLLYYDGMYYGDWEILTKDQMPANAEITNFDYSKLKR